MGNEYHDFEAAKSTLKLLSFEQSLFLNKAKVMFKVANGLVPQYISDLFNRRSEIAHGTSLRSITNQNFVIPKPKLTLYKESVYFIYRLIRTKSTENISIRAPNFRELKRVGIESTWTVPKNGVFIEFFKILFSIQ